MVPQVNTQIAFRVDAGRNVGLGHLKRCLSLAEALQKLHKISPLFVHTADENTEALVREYGFSSLSLSQDLSSEEILQSCLEQTASIWVVDCRSVTNEQLVLLRQSGAAVVSLDDLGERNLPVDVVVNGLTLANKIKYPNSMGVRYLLGPEYALLGSEYWAMPKREQNKKVKRILLTLGGSDQNNVTPQLVETIASCEPGLKLDIIVGPYFHNVAEIETVARHISIDIAMHRSLSSLAQVAAQADLAISAGGQTIYQLACAGCPTIALSVADDQVAHVKSLEECGVVRIASVQDFASVRFAILELLHNDEERTQLMQKAQSLVDGKGALRVAEELLLLIKKKEKCHAY